ncbi:hypothetical protein [Metallibacterium sp.]|uniref:hypothetical protein n=1 Tax=Metallibacterium sp. TaxID=2940281 RepID=UPI002609764A|nr:hypothetical protein [Metallibacterium sp.]
MPSEVQRAATFYEAARVVRALSLTPLRRFMAVFTWTTIALIADHRTRYYMVPMIRNDVEGRNWAISTGYAVRAAMDELARPRAVAPKRGFERHRDTAVIALREARENLLALDCDLRLAQQASSENCAHHPPRCGSAV